MTDDRDLGFGPVGSRAIRSTDPENPTLEPNMKWIGVEFNGISTQF